jgi:hypothetical protein
VTTIRLTFDVSADERADVLRAIDEAAGSHAICAKGQWLAFVCRQFLEYRRIHKVRKAEQAVEQATGG